MGCASVVTGVVVVGGASVVVGVVDIRLMEACPEFRSKEFVATYCRFVE